MKPGYLFLILLLSVALLAALGEHSWAENRQFEFSPPDQDVFVMEASGENYNGLGYLLAGRSISGQHEQFWTLVEVDVSAIPPNAIVIPDEVNLFLYCWPSAPTGNVHLGVYEASASWDEGQVTWYNKPNPVGEPYDITMLYPGSSRGHWDLDDYVQALIYGHPNRGLIIKGTEDDEYEYASFADKEGSGQEGKLEVEVMIPPETPSDCDATYLEEEQEVKVNWSDNSWDEEGFEIWRNGEHYDDVGSNTEEYIDHGPFEAGEEYCYKIRAWDGFRGVRYHSPFSNEDCVTVPDPPNPTITHYRQSANSIPLGQHFDIELRVRNDGGHSDDGAAILCFPAFENDGDTQYVRNNGSSQGDNPGYTEYEHGDLIWHRNGYQFPADYLTVQYEDNNWTPGEENTLKVRVTPQEPGTFTIYVRGNLGIDNQYYNEPEQSTYRDQQGWPVHRYTVNVGTLPPSFSDGFQYEFNQNSNEFWAKQQYRWCFDPDCIHWCDLRYSHVYTVQDDFLVLRVPGLATEGGQVNSERDDFFHGTYRARFRTGYPNGTVNAFFYYYYDYPDSGEIDIEILSSENSEHLVHFTCFGEPSSSTITYDLGFDPSLQFHEYRFDWYPNSVDFFVDGQYAASISENIAYHAGKIILNHWTGNPNWGGGPPADISFMHVDYVMYNPEYTGFEEPLSDIVPYTAWLGRNYPNPFNAQTRIKYAVPEPSDVEIDIYNILGQRIETLFSRKLLPGYHSVTWDASGFSSGIYFYKLTAGVYTEIKRMTLLK